MTDNELLALGQRLADLRIARRLKQTELAYEAGVAHRTLQRLEAGEAVNSAGLIKVIKCLGRLDDVLAALALAEFSPYARLADVGLTVPRLQQQRPDATLSGVEQAAPRKRRVRRAAAGGADSGKHPEVAGKAATVRWPEDQH